MPQHDTSNHVTAFQTGQRAYIDGEPVHQSWDYFPLSEHRELRQSFRNGWMRESNDRTNAVAALLDQCRRERMARNRQGKL